MRAGSNEEGAEEGSEGGRDSEAQASESSWYRAAGKHNYLTFIHTTGLMAMDLTTQGTTSMEEGPMD